MGSRKVTIPAGSFAVPIVHLRAKPFLVPGSALAGLAAPSGGGVEGTRMPRQGPGCGRERRNPAHPWWKLLLSPLPLLSSVHRGFAAVFIHRKAVFGVWRDGSGELELLWKGGTGGGGGEDAARDVLGSPGLPWKRIPSPHTAPFGQEQAL